MKFLFLLLIFTLTLFASVGKIASYDGDVIISRKGKTFDAKVGFSLLKKDIINTKKHSKIKIFFKDATIITIGQNSKLNIAEYLYSEKSPKSSKTNFKFLKGAFSVVTGKIGKIAKKRFKLQTKTATIGIRGTVIVGNQEEIACTKGAIDVTSNGETVIVPAGMFTEVSEGKTPTTPQEYDTEQLNQIDSGLDQNNNYQNRQEYNQQTTQNDISNTNSGSKVENVSIDSDVKNITNIASGNKNIAEQNIHSLDITNSEVKNITIKGKATDVANVSSGSFNEAKQNVGSIKTQ